MSEYKYCIPVTFSSCVNYYYPISASECLVADFTVNKVDDFKGELCGDAYADDYDAAFRSLLNRFDEHSTPYRTGPTNDRTSCSNWDLLPGRSLGDAVLYVGDRVSILGMFFDWLF